MYMLNLFIHLKSKNQIAEFANSADPDEVANNMPPCMVKQCVLSTLSLNSQYDTAERNISGNTADINLVL